MTTLYAPLPHPFERYSVGTDGSITSFVVSGSGRPRRPSVGKDGYVRVLLSAGQVLDETKFTSRTVATRYVHRLVAETFIPNPEGYPDVDHINGVKSDNRVENLRWVTRGENLAAARRRLGNWARSGHGKPVIATPVNPALPSQRWPSARAWAVSSGNPRRAANVCAAIQTGRPAYGYFWRFATAQETPIQ
jgi:hypothetical protein